MKTLLTVPQYRRRGTRGFLEVDLLVGLAILMLAVLPLGYSFVRERRALKIEYCRSVADEIVDGEMEIIAAGAARGRDSPCVPPKMQNYRRGRRRLKHTSKLPGLR